MRWWLACLLAGCEFSHGTASGVPDDGKKMIDAPPDAPPDAFLNPMCFGPPGPYQLCLSSIPTNQTTLNSMSIDTDACDGDATNEQKLMLNGVTVCVIAGSTITVTGTVQASGPNPLVLASTQSLTIAAGATLSVASTTGNNAVKGASANDSSCAGNSTFGIGGNGGGGGGAGATLGGAGGAGGTGSLGAISGGMAAPVGPPITTLRGGCEGGDGGDSSSAVGGGAPGGDGGGALYLATQGVLTIQGTVTASGAAGHGATNSKQGGGGAGSGGMIVIAAHALTMPSSGVVIANGGGGGGGASNTANGSDGSNPTAVGTQAPGGPGAVTGGGDGGKGAAGAQAPTSGSFAVQGGGGGGGGLGIIKMLTTLTLPPTQISPPQS